MPIEVKLIMFLEDGAKRVFEVHPGVTTIGRNNGCTIRIPLAVVSRKHAEITVNDTEVVIKNLSTSNGTFLNNHKVDEEDLEPGDQIAVGPMVFTVQIDGEPADDEIVEIRSVVSKVAIGDNGTDGSVATSTHVQSSGDELDPIAALEALASSADQTAITPEEDD